jgi:hypothetical protein
MRKQFFGVLMLAFVLNVHAQLGLRIFNYRPTGELGFIMKPTFSAEIAKQDGFDDGRFRSGFTLTYLVLKPRLDTFPIIGLMSSGSGDFVLPGKQVFHKYNIFQLGGGFDFAIIYKDPFYLYTGADLIAGGVSIDYYSETPTFEEKSYSGGGGLVGFRLRLGAEYNLNDAFSLFFNANRSYFLVTESGYLSANDYGLGARYMFN